MKLIVNGEAQEVVAETLAEALDVLGYGEAKVATAVNEDFVPAGLRAGHALNDGDRIEIVAPRQGAEDAGILRNRDRLAPDAWHRAISLTCDFGGCVSAVACGDCHGIRAPRGGRGSSRAGLWELIKELNVALLPNTAGCHSVREAVTTAHMARELFDTKWIKLEVIGHADTLQPDPFGLVEAARILTEDGFQVFPYCTEDLVLCDKLLYAGCEVLMPWGAPIGTGLGLNNVYGLRSLRSHYPDVPLVVDAGLGVPSQAAQAIEMGYDAVLLNTAVAKAGDPAGMAEGFALAVEAGALAAAADPMEPRDMAAPSTPVLGKAFL